MTSILTASAPPCAMSARTPPGHAGGAGGLLVKPLVATAGGIINGGTEADIDYIMTH